MSESPGALLARLRRASPLVTRSLVAASEAPTGSLAPTATARTSVAPSHQKIGPLTALGWCATSVETAP
ncbi:MAG: hypothetical protein B7X07_06810, partial [Actinobacteria bacterium 21-64-8]